MKNQRNLILAVVLTGLILFGWDAAMRYFYPKPVKPAATAAALGTLTPMPCVPVIVGPWAPGAPTTVVGGSPMLTAGSQLHCAYGGVISVVVPGSTTTQAS